MIKKFVLILVLGVLSGHSALSKTQIDLKHAEDVCFMNMENMYKAGERQLVKNSKNYHDYFTQLNNLSITISDEFKIAKNKLKLNVYERGEAQFVDTKCYNGLMDLAKKHNIEHQNFTRVYDEIVEKSLLDQFLDFLVNL